jgi:Arc/MetJ-type ribon-helix-helix transcriptional regulator
MKDTQIVVRLPRELADKIDAYSEKLRKEQPEPKWSTSDVVRKLLAAALDTIET